MKIKLTLDKTKHYLLACSFGPDSMALLYLLFSSGYSFSVAHVNYGLRTDSFDETKGLIKICDEWKIPLFIHYVDYPILNNIEEQCREIRYSFFDSIYHKHKFDYLLVAHHQDDHIETYLLQKARKNLVMHYGLQYKAFIFNMKVIRPLLSWTKKDLTSLCVKKNIPFSIDSSNYSLIFERNKIRHQIVEAYDEVERQKVLDEIDFDNTCLLSIINSIDDKQLSSCEYLLSLNDTSFAYAIHFLARKFFQGIELSFGCVKEIKKSLLSKKPNILMKVNNSFFFVKSYGICYFSKDELTNDFMFIVNEPCVIDNDYFFANFTVDCSNRNVQLCDYPLTIRNVRLDDEIQIKDYKVKARRLFIDWKMPLLLRHRWPLIINKDGKIIYIPQYKGDFCKNKNINFYVK